MTHIYDIVTHNRRQLLHHAYCFFNQELFGNTLPAVVIVFHRCYGTYGFFQADPFRRKPGALPNIIALDSDTFRQRGVEAILNILVHEMVHVWQYEYGQPPRRGYHNRQFAMKMRAIGLIVSHNGKPGGRPIGRTVSHYVLPNGLFEQSCRNFMKTQPDLLREVEANLTKF